MMRYRRLTAPLWAWVLAGMAVDFAAVFGVGGVADFGALPDFLPLELSIAIIVMGIAWLSHTMVLPLMFRLRLPGLANLGDLILRGTLYFILALIFATIAGLGGGLLLWAAGIVLISALGLYLGADSQSWLQTVLFCICWIAIFPCAGFAAGGLMYLVRAEGVMANSAVDRNLIRFRSDIAGGALAALLVFGGIFGAQALGIFWLLVPIKDTDGIVIDFGEPRLWPIAATGTLALLPHLSLTGADLRRVRPEFLRQDAENAT